MNPNELEKKIREARTFEATRKDLIGPDGKLGIIVRNLGDPIIEHTEGKLTDLQGGFYGFSSNPLSSFYGDEDEDDEIPVMEQYQGDFPIERPSGPEWTPEKNPRKVVNVQQLGWHFDGLSRGMHLEIKYISETGELTASWQGNPVFMETAGNLQLYTPNADWESKVDVLSKAATIRQKKEKESIKEQAELERVKNKNTFLDMMKKLWNAS